MNELQRRVGTIEAGSKEIMQTLTRLEPALSKLVVDVAEIKGKVSHTPTLLQIGGTMLAINAGIVAVAALLTATLRLLP